MPYDTDGNYFATMVVHSAPRDAARPPARPVSLCKGCGQGKPPQADYGDYHPLCDPTRRWPADGAPRRTDNSRPDRSQQFVKLSRQEAWDLVGARQAALMREGHTARQALELVRKVLPTIYAAWAGR